MGPWKTMLAQCAAFVVVIVLFATFSPAEARIWVVCCGLVCLGLFIAISAHRHKEIRDLAARIDEVLHEGRALDIVSYREGDIAVLANELGKMVTRLSRLGASLETERNALADALADISHQTRTPLTAISLRLPAIEGADDPTSRKYLMRELESMIERVSWLQTTLLKIAKADAGAIHVERREVSAADVVVRAIAPLEAAFDLRGVELSLDLDAKATFQGDALWSAEALQNIVKNCMEHTPSGGCVKIVAAEDALATTITVSDTGAGIDQADLPHLFERFYRGKGENGPAAEGFGIGLSLAQSLVSIQGGTIRASNDPKGGACFRVAFPKLVI